MIKADKDLVWKLIWARLAPPKVEVFNWQILRGRVAVKEELLIRRCLGAESALCPLCGGSNETISHLFFMCRFTWVIWMTLCRLWDVVWVMLADAKMIFLAWQEVNRNNAWRLTFYAITWSIWMAKNDVVFNGKSFDVRQVVDSIKLRTAVWLKAKWPGKEVSIDDIIRFPNLVEFNQCIKPRSSKWVWKRPDGNHLKFNVDG